MPRPDPLTAMATPDHWMVVQFGDGAAYVAEPVEFIAFDPVARFPTKADAQSAIHTAQSMATIDLSILLARTRHA